MRRPPGLETSRSAIRIGSTSRRIVAPKTSSGQSSASQRQSRGLVSDIFIQVLKTVYHWFDDLGSAISDFLGWVADFFTGVIRRIDAWWSKS